MWNKITPRNRSLTASFGSYIFELCHIGANQGLTAEIDWNYISRYRRCRKFLIGAVVWAEETVVVRGNGRISTQNRKIPEMTVPIINFDAKPKNTRNDSSYNFLAI